jgi:hypothetical protein
MMKFIDYKSSFRNFTGMLGRNVECCVEAVFPKLS